MPSSKVVFRFLAEPTDVNFGYVYNLYVKIVLKYVSSA